MDTQITDCANRPDHRPVHPCLRGDYLLLGIAFPNRQQYHCASWSAGFGYILPKERNYSFGHCFSRQPDGPANACGRDSQRTSKHLPFLQIHLIPAPVSLRHRGFSCKEDISWQPHGSCLCTLAKGELPEPLSLQLSTM